MAAAAKIPRRTRPKTRIPTTSNAVKNKKSRKRAANQKIEDLIGLSSTADVDGSYTGTPLKGGLPVQDADDL